MDTMPESKLVKKQVKTYRAEWQEGGKTFLTIARVRHDDQCGNGHNSFSITGDLYGERGSRRDGKAYTEAGKALYWLSGGCIHEEIAEHLPQLAPYLKWHLTDTDAPMHYAANTIYLAGDRDCWGLRKGEKRQLRLRNGNTGKLAWKLATVDESGNEADEKLPRYVDSDTCPPGTLRTVYVPWYRIGEGKDRELDAARRAAVWPEATDAELMQEPDALRAMLLARLPGLMAEFKRDVENLGFVY